MQAKENWLTRFRFHTALGVVDCKHILTENPTQLGDEYVNRKGFSVSPCSASWPGSVHDSCTCNYEEVKKRYSTRRQ
nr:unnamed protein product [Callosobruchus analis]